MLSGGFMPGDYKKKIDESENKHHHKHHLNHHSKHHSNHQSKRHSEKKEIPIPSPIEPPLSIQHFLPVEPPLNPEGFILHSPENSFEKEHPEPIIHGPPKGVEESSGKKLKKIFVTHRLPNNLGAPSFFGKISEKNIKQEVKKEPELQKELEEELFKISEKSEIDSHLPDKKIQPVKPVLPGISGPFYLDDGKKIALEKDWKKDDFGRLGETLDRHEELAIKKLLKAEERIEKLKPIILKKGNKSEIVLAGQIYGKKRKHKIAKLVFEKQKMIQELNEGIQLPTYGVPGKDFLVIESKDDEYESKMKSPKLSIKKISQLSHEKKTLQGRLSDLS